MHSAAHAAYPFIVTDKWDYQAPTFAPALPPDGASTAGGLPPWRPAQ